MMPGQRVFETIKWIHSCTEPLASLVKLVLGNSKSAIPIELALCCWAAGESDVDAGAAGGAKREPLGGMSMSQVN
jgi:hypothetical protein